MEDLKDIYFKHLFGGSGPSSNQRAKELRQCSTEAEKKLWQHLRNRQIKGKKFRRQHPFAGYILDFYCHECKLAIELDGNYHKNEKAKKYDAARTGLLNLYGIKVLRFWNSEVLKNVDDVIKEISSHFDR